LLTAAAPEVDSFPHPTLAPPASWPGVLVIVIILGFFATAAVLGPAIRAIMGDESDE
jgi:hypothetical protein